MIYVLNKNPEEHTGKIFKTFFGEAKDSLRKNKKMTGSGLGLRRKRKP
jgi:signal transduction histidine kinase